MKFGIAPKSNQSALCSILKKLTAVLAISATKENRPILKRNKLGKQKFRRYEKSPRDGGKITPLFGG